MQVRQPYQAQATTYPPCRAVSKATNLYYTSVAMHGEGSNSHCDMLEVALTMVKATSNLFWPGSTSSCQAKYEQLSSAAPAVASWIKEEFACRPHPHRSCALLLASRPAVPCCPLETFMVIKSCERRHFRHVSADISAYTHSDTLANLLSRQVMS